MNAGAQTAKIIVSYRRTDSAMAGRIFDRLVQRFGKKSLFIDIDNIPFGGDFRKHIDEALKSSDLLIALVGPKWVGGEGKDAKITRDADPVRVEIETALKQNIPVLPVLLDEARMPEPSELPENIREFAYRNAAEVEPGRDFDVHVDRLIKAVEQILGAKAPPPSTGSGASAASRSAAASLLSPAPSKPKSARKILPIALSIAAVAAALVGAWLARDRIVASGTSTVAYCDNLKRVVTEARTNFDSILGPTSTSSWPSRIKLSGWDECRVMDFTFEGVTKRYHYCQVRAFATLEAIRARRDEVAAEVKSCLGPDWSEGRSEFSDKTTDTIFYMGTGDPIVRIRESYAKDSKEWYLNLEVEALPSAAKQPETKSSPPEVVSDRPQTSPPAAN